MANRQQLPELLRCLPSAHVRCVFGALGGARTRWDEWLVSSGAMTQLDGTADNTEDEDGDGTLHLYSLPKNGERAQYRGYEHWLAQPTPDVVRDQIDKDLERSAAGEEISLESLRRILTAHAGRNPKIGYTQGLNFITVKLLGQCQSSASGFLGGVLLPWISSASFEAEVFWMLCVITDRLLPEYYEPPLIGVRTDTLVLDELMASHTELRDLLPIFESLQFQLAMVTPHWLMLMYGETLPLDSVTRVWDLFFVEGSRVLLATALAILYCQAPLIRKVRQDLGEVYKLLRSSEHMPTGRQLHERVLIELHALSESRVAELRRSCRPRAQGDKAVEGWIRAMQMGGEQGLRLLVGVGELTGRSMQGVGDFTGKSLEFTGKMLKAGVAVPVKLFFPETALEHRPSGEDEQKAEDHSVQGSIANQKGNARERASFSTPELML
uniref:Rab-GAP TBC domain-containing protein n=1 Tax=Haptolina brevifila TaxID=156173 RepID=A0A7S2J6U9_9EUKA